MKLGQRVRFLRDSRHGDWKRGALGSIEWVLAHPPYGEWLYIVSIEDGSLVWAKGSDLEPFDQLTIYDTP